MKVKDQFLACCHFGVRDGSQSRFWEVVGDEPFSVAYPILYKIMRRKDATISHTLSSIYLLMCPLGGHWLAVI